MADNIDLTADLRADAYVSTTEAVPRCMAEWRC